jgi:hypothetical protein
MAKKWYSKDQIIKALIRDGVTTKHLAVRLSQADNLIPKSEKEYVNVPGKHIFKRYSGTAYQIFLSKFKTE